MLAQLVEPMILRLEGWMAGHADLLANSSEGKTTLLISEGGLTSSMTMKSCSNSKEADELLVSLAEPPTLVVLSFCHYNHASILNLS